MNHHMSSSPKCNAWLSWCVDSTQEHAAEPPTLLLECGDLERPAHLARALARAGFEVNVCGGPAGSKRCPLLDGEECDLVNDAAIIVNAFGVEDRWRAELLAMTLAATDVPVVILSHHEEPQEPPTKREGRLSPQAARDIDELLAVIQAAKRRGRPIVAPDGRPLATTAPPRADDPAPLEHRSVGTGLT